MKTLIMLVGIPRSGKTTLRNQLVTQFKYPVVCPDTIRLSLHGQVFDGTREKEVWTIARVMVECLFEDGQSTVILDATNITESDRNKWKSDKYKRVFYHINTPKEVCISRIEVGKNDYLRDVIERMSS